MEIPFKYDEQGFRRFLKHGRGGWELDLSCWRPLCRVPPDYSKEEWAAAFEQAARELLGDAAVHEVLDEAEAEEFLAKK